MGLFRFKAIWFKILVVTLLLIDGPMSLAKASSGGKKPLQELKLREGDERGNEVKSLKAELMVSKTENKAIQQIEKLIKKHKGSEVEAGLHFRLAELYMRKSKTDRFFEVHRESDTVVHLAPKAVQSASSKKSIGRAAEIYSYIQKTFPQFEQMDLVVYNHAFARQSMGEEKEAEKLYWNLVNNHPRSPLVPDAHLAIGELAFNRSQFSVALDQFNAIQKYPRSRVYPYGLYKAAWTLYNMREAEKGLKKLEEVVEFGRQVAKRGIDARLDLRKEALADMTLFFEEVYPSKEAFDYFSKQAGESEAGPILLKMASLYERHSRFNDQKVVLDRFVEAMPTSPLLPQVQNDLVAAYDHLRQTGQAVQRLNQLADLCQPGSRWLKAQPKEAGAACIVTVNETAIRLAKKWLKAWKKLPSDTSYADASERAFEIYFKTPGSGEEYQQSRFTYAELLFARQKFRQASKEYALVDSQSGGGNEVTHNAAYGAIVSLEKAVGEKWSNDDEKTFHSLAEEYIRKNPKGQYRLDVQYKMALLAYEKERFDEAAPQFLRIGREFPNQEKGQKSQDLYLDILNIKKDYKGVRQYAHELIKLNGADPTRETKMRGLYEQAYFLEIQSLEEKGDLKQALSEYENFAKQNSSSPLTEKAMWNITQLHLKLGNSWGGAKSAEAFADKFPKSNQAVNALLSAAQTFEQMGQLGEAARVLGKLAVQDTKSTQRWKELAADFYALNGDVNESRSLFNELKNSGDNSYRAKILSKLEILEKTHGTPQSQGEIARAMIQYNVQPFASLAKVQIVERLLADKKTTQAFNEAKHYMGAGLSPDLKARLRLVQAKVLTDEFMNQSVKSRAERVATVLAIKTEKLEKAQQALQSTIKYGNARTSLEAFELLYGCYNHYVKALKEMPTPAGLSDADAKAFRDEIANLVIPLEEKGVDTLAQAVKFARQQKFLDGSLSRLETELNRLNGQVGAEVAPSLEMPGIALPDFAGVSP